MVLCEAARRTEANSRIDENNKYLYSSVGNVKHSGRVLLLVWMAKFAPIMDCDFGTPFTWCLWTEKHRHFKFGMPVDLGKYYPRDDEMFKKWLGHDYITYFELCDTLYVCPSTKSFFDFSEIWHVGRCRFVIHNGMQYDLI